MENKRTILDGGISTALFAAGCPLEYPPELWGLGHPDKLRQLHQSFVWAGSQMITTNTFGANKHRLIAFDATVDTVTTNITLVRTARKVAGDLPLLGSIGPAVPSECEDAGLIADAVGDQIEGLSESEIDRFFLETQISFFQSKTIFELIRKVSEKPIWVSFSYVGQIATDPDGFEQTLRWFEQNGAEAIGINCAPALAEEYPPLIRRLAKVVSIPIIARPGAGLPAKATIGLEFPESPEHFAEGMEQVAASGAKIVGGCCGVTPRHIQLIKHL